MSEISISFYNNSSVRQECLSRGKRRHKTGCRYLPTYDVGGVASELREKDGGRVGKRERRELHRRRGAKTGLQGVRSKYVGQQGGAGTARHTPMQ